MVLLGFVASFNPRLAREDIGTGLFLSDQHAHYLARHHHLVGSPHGSHGAKQRRRGTIP